MENGQIHASCFFTIENIFERVEDAKNELQKNVCINAIYKSKELVAGILRNSQDVIKISMVKLHN